MVYGVSGTLQGLHIPSISLALSQLVYSISICCVVTTADFCPRNTDNPQAVATRNNYSVTPLNVTALYAVSLLGLHLQGAVTRESDFPSPFSAV